MPTYIAKTWVDNSGGGTPITAADLNHIEQGIASAANVLVYDKTGSTGASAALQASIDSGDRHIIIPPGQFLCDGPVFYDAEDGNATLRIAAHGVVFIASTGMPTVAEFDTYCTNIGVATGCRFFLFPSTYRAALSSGVVTCTGHDVTGTSTYPTTRNGISPHLIVEGGTFSANPLTNYNGGFVFGNVGGATEMRSVHMDSARTLLSWTGYVDANKMINCAGWGATNMSATNDAWLFYQITSGDGVYVYGSKTDNFIGVAALDSCNGAHITSKVGATYRFRNCHAINISSNHTETASNIAVVNRQIYYIRDSHVTIQGSFDYLTDTTTDGAIYLDDSGGEGAHSRIDLLGYFGRQWLTTSDPVGGFGIYINNMNDRTKIKVLSSETEMSVSGAFSTAYAPMGLTISGNTTNEPTLTAALAAGRDLIASGDFMIYKYKTSSTSTGQNQAMSIGISNRGNLGGIYRARTHVTPTFYDAENYGTGTLANSTLYSYAAAVCNTLPDGTIQYGAATAEWQQTTPSSGGAQGFEMYTPSAANGATVVIWRKTAAGVLSTPDRYVIIPVGAAATRFLDTGANINKVPWITTSVPVPNTVAAINHTFDQVYRGTTPRAVDSGANYYLNGASQNVNETFPRNSATLTAVAPTGWTTGTMFSMAIYLPAGAVISNITFRSSGTGSGTAGHGWFALYSNAATPALMAQTADQTGASWWASATVKTLALTTPQVITQSGTYYVSCMVASGTMPTLTGTVLNDTSESTGFVTGQKVLAQVSGSALTTTAPATITGGTAVTQQVYGVTS